MNRIASFRLLFGLAVLTGIGVGYGLDLFGWGEPAARPGLALSAEANRLPKQERKAARLEHWQRLLSDPATGRIPANIRGRELAFAREEWNRQQFAKRTTEELTSFGWQELGPDNVGGRTRAMAQSYDDPDVLLAGGVTGGLWKSEDKGQTWRRVSDPLINAGVTTLAQDPNETNKWVYSAGEYRGSAARGGLGVLNADAPYFGSGIFFSEDGGENWLHREYSQTADRRWSTTDPITTTPTRYVSPFNFTSRTVIANDGSIIVACNVFGLFRSTDDGQNFDWVLGFESDPTSSSERAHTHNDLAFDVASGRIFACIGGNRSFGAGLYVSDDNGVSWREVTPNSFPSYHLRGVIDLAASNPSVGYVMTTDGAGNGMEDIGIFKVDLANGGGQDLSANRPNLVINSGGTVNTQVAYNMVCKVHPQDEDFVVVGGVNLFRSTDGFSTPLTGSANLSNWIGGWLYPNPQWADQHYFLFDRSNPDRAFSMNDGGLYFTSNVRAAQVDYQDLNNGYNVTQFYTGALRQESDGNYTVVGGTQDNGTPFLYWEPNRSGTFPELADASGGDGAYCAFDPASFGPIYVSAQNGFLIRLLSNEENVYISELVYPLFASGFLFIAPFDLSPNDPDVIAYPAGRQIWINERISQVQGSNTGGITEGWYNSEAINAPSGTVSAVRFAEGAQDRLYYATYADGARPSVYRVDGLLTDPQRIDISVPNLPASAYINGIGVNPDDEDEILIAATNYNIVGLYRSTDGGQTYTAIEGNLVGTDELPGPSIRWAEIVNFEGRTSYLLATSTGVYTSQRLEGADTYWRRTGTDTIGSTIVNQIDIAADGRTVLAATHGRGLFVGRAKTVTALEEEATQADDLGDAFTLYPNPYRARVRLKATDAAFANASLLCKVYDQSGRVVLEALGTVSEVNAQLAQKSGGWPAGVYALRLRSGKQSGTIRFVKQ